MTEESPQLTSAQILAEGIVNLLKPTVEELDEKVISLRQSQMELKQNIDFLTEDLKKTREQQQVSPIELDVYLKKLSNSRRRVMLISNILQNLQERIGKLHVSVSKETARRKTLLDSPTTGSLT